MKRTFTIALMGLLMSASPSLAQYCTAVYTNTSDDWISNVTFAGINNNSNSVGYQDFTNLVGNIEIDGIYPFSVTVSTNGTWDQYLTIFIDWNQDEIFQESTERYNIGFQTISSSYTFTGNITVPSNALAGTTRMRVIEDYNNYPPAGGCVNDTYGEAEDYTLSISEPVSEEPDNAGVDDIISPNLASSMVCAGDDSVLVVIRNFGSNQINSLDVDWTMGGIAQPTFSFTGLLDTLGGVFNNTDTVNLGSITLSQATNIVAWTTMPNGNNDTINDNDTSAITVDSVINVVLDLGPTKYTCDGAFVVLKNIGSNQTFDDYDWSTGSGASSTAVNTPGTYSVTVTYGPPNCQASDDIQVLAASNPTVDLGEDIESCGNAVLDAQNAGSTFSWSNGDTSQIISAASSGSYSVSVTSPEGCFGSDEIGVTINPLPQVSLGNDFEICIDDGGATNIGPLNNPNNTYLWSNNKTTNQIFVGTAESSPGNKTFWLQVTDTNGCIGSDTIQIRYKLCKAAGLTSIDNSESWVIYPMPIDGNATIDVNTNAGNIEISLFSLNGEKIRNVYSGHSDGDVQINADLNDLAAGVYILQLQTDEFVSNKQIMVQK